MLAARLGCRGQALQQATGHVVDAAKVPWWAFGTGVAFAIATSVLASRRLAQTMAAVPVVAALSGRSAPPKAVHRSALPGVIVFAAGVAGLAFTGGWTGGGGGGSKDALLLLVGLVATIVGILLLAPLAAITFAVFLATAICLVASIQFGNPLNWFGSNLSGNQLIISTQQQLGGGTVNQLNGAQVASLGRQVDRFAAGLHAQSVLPLESGGVSLDQTGTQGPHGHFNGSVYVATPQLLATYGIKASQVRPGTDLLTMRPGLASLPHTELTWGNYGLHGTSGGFTQKDNVLPPCTLSSDCLANPAVQTVSGLPGGTSAPNTVITEYAVSKYHLQPSPNGWLIQTPAPLTAAQISAARHLALGYQVTAETKSDGPSLGEFADGATALGLLGTILGLAGALVAVLAWTHGNLSVMFGDVPLADVLVLLIGLPLIAAVAGWLLAGREPPLIARQPIE